MNISDFKIFKQSPLKISDIPNVVKIETPESRFGGHTTEALYNLYNDPKTSATNKKFISQVLENKRKGQYSGYSYSDMSSELENQRKLKATASSQGRNVGYFDDTIRWLENNLNSKEYSKTEDYNSIIQNLTSDIANIEQQIESLKKEGRNSGFIENGGFGAGGQGSHKRQSEINALEKEKAKKKEYITQAQNQLQSLEIQLMIPTVEEKGLDNVLKEYNSYLPQSNHVVSEDTRNDTRITAYEMSNYDSPAATAGAFIGNWIAEAIRGTPTPKATDGINTTSFKITDRWTEDAKKALAALYLIDKERAVKFASETNRAIDLGEFEEFAAKNWGTAVLSAGLQVPFTLAGGIEWIENAAEYGIKKARGEETELRRSYGADVSNALISGGKKAVDWNIKGWDAWDFLYGTGTSALNTLAASAMFGKAGGVFLGLSAASSATNDILDRGGTDLQALVGGGVSGLFEGVFETISLSKLKAFETSDTIKFLDVLTDEGKKNVKQYFKVLGKDIAKSMVVNAYEEGLTEFANIMYDTVVNKDISNYSTLYNDYIKQGYSPDEARMKACSDLTMQVIESMGSGALMGMGFAGLGTTSAYKSAKGVSKNTWDLYGDSAQKLINEGLNSPVGSESRIIAERLQEKINNGEQVTGGNLRSLIEANEQQFRADDTAKINNAIKNRLSELGETADVDTVSKAITKQVSGEQLTKAEQKAISESRFGQRVLNEATADNIKSGDYSSAWAESIGTDRINSDAYNLGVQDIDAAGNNGYNNTVENANVGGFGNDSIERGDKGSLGERVGSDTRAEGSIQRSFQESSEAFSERSSREQTPTGQRGRVLLRFGSSLMAYTPMEANDSTNGGRAVNLLRGIGINAEFAEGDIETNTNGITIAHNQALTTNDGKVYVSDNATLSDVEIAAHESVHVNDVLGTEAFLNYEAVICEQTNYDSDKYLELANLINKSYYNGKYDIESIDFYDKFRREISAYINQFVVTDLDFATQQFSDLFYDWDAVVEASRQFNKDIGADFSESASLMPENSELQSTAVSKISTLSAANPEYNPIEDLHYKSVGVERLTADQKKLKKVGQQFGAKVSFRDLDEIRINPKTGKEFLFSPEGQFDPETNTITLNTNVKDYHRPLEYILKHELTHSLEIDKENYALFATQVLRSEAFTEYVRSKGFESADAWAADIIKQYSGKGVKGYQGPKAQLLANQEMVANFVGDMLFGGQTDITEKLLNSMTPTQRKGFIAKIKEFFAKLKQLFKGTAELTEIERLENLFLETANKVATNNKTATEGSGDIVYSANGVPIIDLSNDNELSKKVSGIYGNARYKIIQNYILEVLNNKSILLSDGKRAIVDKSDAKHVASNAGEKKTLQISKIQNIVENAKFVAEEESTKNGKFDYFYYYEALVRFDKESYPIYLNVGKAKNDATFHIYDITQKLRDTAHRVNDVGRPVGNALESSISINSIPENENTVNNNYAQGDKQYSFAVEKNASLVDKAEQLERELKAENKTEDEIREVIWKEYQIIRDPEGVWKYEIDDSDMEVYPNGDLFIKDHPDYKEYRALQMMKQRTEEQDDRFAELDDMFLLEYGFGEPLLKNYAKHDKLFAKYPQLKEAKIDFDELGPGERGFYDPTNNRIVLDERFKMLDRIGMNIDAIHEIQHVMQNIDDTEPGASEKYWNARLLRGDRLPINPATGKQYTPYEAYMRTRGEIEARESASRVDMTEEQRRETVPNLGWENSLSAREPVLTSEYDAEYSSAIESGNTAKAQRMVDAEIANISKGKEDLINGKKGVILPEPDISKDMRSEAERISEIVGGKANAKHVARQEVRELGKELGWKVLYGDVYAKDANGNLIYIKDQDGNLVPKRAEAKVDKSNKTITIDYQNKNPIKTIVKHELTHFLELNSKTYSSFAKKVFSSEVFEQWLSQASVSDIDEYRDSIISQYIGSKGFETIEAAEISADFEIVARFVADNLFNNDGQMMQRIAEMMNPTQRSKFYEFICSIFEKLKVFFKGKDGYSEVVALEREWVKAYRAANSVWESQFGDKISRSTYSALETHFMNKLISKLNEMKADSGESAFSMPLDEYFIGKHTSAKNETNNRGYLENVAKTGKSRYNEYQSNVMQWAYNSSTNTGDVKLFNDRGKEFVFNEATEDGYIEIARGTYEEVRELYEEMQRRADNSSYGYSQKFRYEQRRNMRAEFNGEAFGGNGVRNYKSDGEQKFRTDTTGNFEAFRTGDKGEQLSNKADSGESANFIPSARIRRSAPIDLFENIDYNDDTHYGERLKNTPNSLKPTTEREWQAFCRSFDNQTNGMKNNEYRIASVFTADNHYIIEAEGYMRGRIVSKSSIIDYREKERFFDDYNSSKVFNVRNDRNGNRQGYYSNDSDPLENGGTDTFYVEMDEFIEQHPKWFTNKGKTYRDFIKELNKNNSSKQADSGESANFMLDAIYGDTLRGVDSHGGNVYNSTVENGNAGGKINGSKDAELLAGGQVSAVGGGSNSLREQSPNTAKLNGYLGNLGERQRHDFVNNGAGESGWLVQEGNSESQVSGFKEGVLRTVSGIELSGKDTVGRVIDSRLLEKFKNTVFKDENGNLLSLYHWTTAIFDKFAKGEFGFHLGTLEAAHDRYLEKVKEESYTPIGNYKEVYVNITNPIELKDNSETWDAAWVALQLKKKGLITRQQEKQFSTIESFYEATYDNPAAQAVRGILFQLGYDGIIYKNDSEGGGNYSVIALKPEQIITVAENGVLKENIGVTEADWGESAFSMPFDEEYFIAKHNLSGNGINNGYVENVAKKAKSRYNEYQSNVMQWAYSLSTNIGDVKLFNDRGKQFVLNEATEDGYIEIARGTYEELKEIEQSYKESTDTVYVHTTMYENAKTGDFTNNSTFKNKREYGQSGRTSESEQFSVDTTGNYATLRTGDKGEQFDRGGSLRESEEAYSGDDGVKQSPEIDREEKFYSELMRGLLSANGTEDAQLPKKDENANVGGNINGGQNAELLAGGQVSAVSGGRDSLREQSSNTAKLNGYLEKSKTVLGLGFTQHKAGESGWLVKSASGLRSNKAGQAGFEEGILRAVSGITPSGRDTIGRIIDSKVLEEFKDTVFKDENGNLLSLYHWTTATFDKFAKGEFGFHLGTLEAAHDRYLQKLRDNPDTPIGNYKEVYVNIKNPIELSDENSVWEPSWVVFQLKNKGLITQEQYDGFSVMEGFFDATYDNPAAQAVRGILFQLGYDGIIYKNDSEGGGNYSVIALKPEQIITVAENGVLKENIGVTEADSGESAFSMPFDEEYFIAKQKDKSKLDKAGRFEMVWNGVDLNSEAVYNEKNNRFGNVQITEEQKQQYKAAILKYKSSESYTINAKLREGEPLSEADQEFVETLDAALLTLPTYEGIVYRQLVFDDFGGEDAFNKFLNTHNIGIPVLYEQFTSCSKTEDGYTVEGKNKVQLIIDGKNAHDVAGFGNNMEDEVIYSRNSVFIIRDIVEIGECIKIYLQEDVENGYNTIKERGGTVWDLQEPYFWDSNLQGVSKKNTVGNSIREIRPQSTAPAGQWNTVRAEGGQNSVLSSERSKQVTKADSGESAFSMPFDEEYFIAKQRDISVTEKAEVMEKRLANKGLSDFDIAYEVWKKYGVVRDDKGEWVYEINDWDLHMDKHGRVRGNTDKKNLTVPDYIDLPRLYEKYPELNDVRVIFKRGLEKKEGVPGYYDHGTDEIVIDKALLDNPNKLERVFIHEIQHAIQKIDGRDSGSSESFWIAYQNIFLPVDMPTNKDTSKENMEITKMMYDMLTESLPAPVTTAVKEFWEAVEAGDDDRQYEIYEFAMQDDEFAEMFEDYSFWHYKYHRLFEDGVNVLSPREAVKYSSGEMEARMVVDRFMEAHDRALTEFSRRVLDGEKFENPREVLNDMLKRDRGVPIYRPDLAIFEDEFRQKALEELERRNREIEKAREEGRELVTNVNKSNYSGVEKLSETQYNDFGWVRQNDVLTPYEYNTLLSRFADFKHNKDKYPVTRFGEAVIHSTECPNVIMYVKGNIGNPQITKVVKINYFDISEIKEEILSNERRHLSQPYKSIESLYGQEIFSISKARDYASFRQFRAEQEGRGGAKSDSFGAEQFDRGGSLRESEEAYSGDEGVKRSPEKDREEKFYSELMRGLLTADGANDTQLPIREAGNADSENKSNVSATSKEATDEDLIKSLMSGLGVKQERETVNTSNNGELARPYPEEIVPEKVRNYLSKLQNYGDTISVQSAPSFEEISLMSRQSGTEFASITIGNKHYIIKGDREGTPISKELLNEMKKYKGVLNCHSHPFVGDLKASQEDIEFANEIFWQKKFYIITPDGKISTYTKFGVMQVNLIEKLSNAADLEFYENIFKEK